MMLVSGGGLPKGGSVSGGGLPPGDLHLGGSASGGLGRPPKVCIWEGGQTPPQDTWDNMGYGQQVGNMHPTAMLFSLID